MLPTMTTYTMRKKLGDRHEERVTEELRKRGWRVTLYGMGTQRALPKAMIAANGSPLRYEPDLMISPYNAPHRVHLIDCKAQFDAAETHPAVNEECVRAQLALMGAVQLPIWYVFSDLSVCAPNDVIGLNDKIEPSIGSAHFRVPACLNRGFDSVFGPVPAEQLAIIGKIRETLAA